jgi:hypothetical protein
MNQYTFSVNGLIRKELQKHGVRPGLTVSVRSDSYDHFLKSIRGGGYEHLTADEQQALAIGCCYSHPDHKAKHMEPLIPPIKKIAVSVASRVHSIKQWNIFGTWAFRFLVILFLVLIFSFSAHCQGTSQIDVITFQDNSGVPIKSFAAPFKIKCGANLTCTASGSVLTFAGAAAGSGTVTSFSAGTLSPLFTTSVANATTTPALTFSLSNAAAHTFFGNNTGSTAAPAFSSIGNGDLPGSGALTINASSPLGGGGSVALGASLSLTCTGCLTSVTAHNLLSATHGDTTAGTVARGDLITGQGASPTWTRLPKGTANQLLAMDGTGTDIIWSTVAGSGASTADSFVTINHDADLTGERTLAGTAGDITITDGGANASVTLDTGANIPKITTSNNYSAGTTQDFDAAVAKYWTAAPIFMLDQFSGTDLCDKMVTLQSDATFIAATRAVIDGRGITGAALACATATAAFNARKNVKLILPSGNITFTQYFFFGGGGTINSADLIAAPAAPTLATSTTGGSLAAATTYGVKVSYGNINYGEALNGESAGSSEATKLTGAGATNSITVTSPATVDGAVCYNVYSTATAGSNWKLNNTSGCIPLGTSYVIKTVGAGVAPLTTGTAVNGITELEGQGESTILLLNGSNSAIFANLPNLYLHDFQMIQGPSNATTSSIQMSNNVGSNLTIRNVTISGGGHGIFIGSGNSNIKAQNIRCGKWGRAGDCILVAGSATDIWIDTVGCEPGVMPAFASTFACVYLQNVSRFRATGVTCNSIDFSLVTNAACILTDGSSYGVIDNPVSDSLINADGVAIVDLSHHVVVAHPVARNMNCGTPIGTNKNNGDAVDIFGVGQIEVSDIIADGNCAQGGTALPLVEVYSSQSVTLKGGHISGGAAEGISMFGNLSAKLSDLDVTLNQRTGMLVQDESLTVSCNGTTTITRVSGQIFGPYAIGTPFTVGAQSLTVAAVPTSGSTLIANAACTTGNPLTFTMSATDMLVTHSNFDTNGRDAGHVACTDDGICFSGANRASLSQISANDNQTTKHQPFGLRLNNTARVSCENCNFSSNLTGPYIDNPGTSYIDLDDGTTDVHTVTAQNKLGQADIIADTGAISTTETILLKTAALPANHLTVGKHYRAKIVCTTTDTVANTSTFTVRIGTLGTTSDAAIATAVTGVSGTTGTSIPFKAIVDFTVRTTGASGTGFVSLEVTSNATTGIITSTGPAIILPTMSTFNTQTANNILSFSLKTAATTTAHTCKQGTLEPVQN